MQIGVERRRRLFQTTHTKKYRHGRQNQRNPCGGKTLSHLGRRILRSLLKGKKKPISTRGRKNHSLLYFVYIKKENTFES